MKLNKILGFMIALTLSSQVMAYGQDELPPFDSIVCKAGNTSVLVQIKHYRQTYGAGPAFININGASWMGGWNWQAADEGTRLTGYYHLNIKANGQNGRADNGPISLRALYNPLDGNFSGGWLLSKVVSSPVNCEILN